MFVLYILLALAVLLFMVLVHEFGHYVIGRMLGFKITEFSVGFGKALFSRRNKRGELISVRLIPLGGFCSFVGEEEDKPDNPDAFNNQAPWKRILVFLGGVTFNFATAIIFSLILLCTAGYDIPQVKKDIVFDSTAIEHYVEDSYQSQLSPDEGLQVGDVIISINGNAIDFAYGTTYQEQYNIEWAKLQEWLKAEENQDKTFMDYPRENFATATVRRNGEVVDVTLGFYKIETYVYEKGVQVFEDEDKTIPKILTQYGWNDVEMGPYVHTFGEGLRRAVPFSFGLAWTVLESLWQLITFQLPISQFGGPITTISTIATFAQANSLNLLVLIPLISANLAVFNLLPIPALDGAHVIFTLVEWIRKKPIKRETEALIHTIGLFILFGAVILIDILHFIL